MTIWNRARLRQQQGPRRLTAPMALYPAELSLVRDLETCRACGYQVHAPSCPTLTREIKVADIPKPAERPKNKPCPTCGYQWTLTEEDTNDCAVHSVVVRSHQVHRDAWLARKQTGKPCPTCGWQPEGISDAYDCSKEHNNPCSAHRDHEKIWKASGALPGWHAHMWPSGAIGFVRRDRRAAVWQYRDGVWSAGPPTTNGNGDYGYDGWGRRACGKFITAQEAMAYANAQLRKDDEAGK